MEQGYSLGARHSSGVSGSAPAPDFIDGRAELADLGAAERRERRRMRLQATESFRRRPTSAFTEAVTRQPNTTFIDARLLDAVEQRLYEVGFNLPLIAARRRSESARDWRACATRRGSDGAVFREWGGESDG